ncbi:MAG: electron carrier [Sclerophora amabilis]|nr:MAG: electron carrier [Sclerophora amabilis]
MAPSVALDVTSDFSSTVDFSKPKSQSTTRTLILSPPSLSSHPESLNAVFATYGHDTTDFQMLDRLSLGLVSLPEATYDLVLILTDPDGTRSESSSFLNRELLAKIVLAMKEGARLKSQDGTFATAEDGQERAEAVLAGLIVEGREGIVKPNYAATHSVPLRLNRKSPSAATSPAAPNPETSPRTDLNGKGTIGEVANGRPTGVGFVDFSDDLGDSVMEEDDDDELIDEDTLLDEEDLARPIVQPPECRPKSGKRRRACKDCTCGLKQKIDAEDAAKRTNADDALINMKLGANDLAEVDFTVQGKVGSCGNCSLGDAFRCDGCPYIGLPAFKLGEEVKLLNNDVQL